jgi:hypothetical protein
VEQVVEVKEDPLTEEQVLQLITATLKNENREKLALRLGITPMEWEEYVQRSGEKTTYLVIRRAIIGLGKLPAFAKISDIFTGIAETSESGAKSDSSAVLADLARLTKAVSEDEPVFLSKFESLKTTGVSEEAQKFGQSGPWKPGIEKPEAEAGMHLGKMFLFFWLSFLPLRGLAPSVTAETHEKGQTRCSRSLFLPICAQPLKQAREI